MDILKEVKSHLVDAVVMAVVMYGVTFINNGVNNTYTLQDQQQKIEQIQKDQTRYEETYTLVKDHNKDIARLKLEQEVVKEETKLLKEKWVNLDTKVQLLSAGVKSEQKRGEDLNKKVYDLQGKIRQQDVSTILKDPMDTANNV